MKLNELTFNVVATRSDTELTQATVSWPILREYFTETALETRPDKDGQAIIPCSVHNPTGRRLQENMDQMFLLMLDCDEGMSIDAFKEKLKGVEAQVHTTYSHTLEKNKVRAALPLKAPILASQVGIVFDALNTRFDEKLDTSCGHDSAHLYYLPACPPGRESLFQSVHIEGEWLDAQAIIDAHVKSPAFLKNAPASRASTSASTTGVGEGSRNNTGFKMACRLFNDGKMAAEVISALETWNETCNPPLESKELATLIKSAEKKVTRSVALEEDNVETKVQEMNQKYLWIKKQGKAFRKEFGDFVSIESLRQTYANKGMLVNISGRLKWQCMADIWHKSSLRLDYDNVDFMPGKPPVYRKMLNLWTGWSVKPDTGDISPWTELLDHIFDGDPVNRQWFEQWVAYPVQHPGTKLSTAVVLWSLTQGVGKSMIGETLCNLYGEYGRMITAAELHSPFNPWMKGAQFILGEENSSSDRRADSNRLKVLITGVTVTVNDKYQPAIELKNAANFIFTSNDPSAFHLDDSDRRFFVHEITVARKSDAFYERYAAWRDSSAGLSALMAHLLKLDLNGFLPKGNAPMTESKEDMIRQSKSDLDRWISEMLEDPIRIKEAFGKEVVHIDDVVREYNRSGHGRSNSTAISRALRRTCRHAKRRVSCRKGRRQNLISLTNHEHWEESDGEAWADEYSISSPLSHSLH